jgi:hypothetical protein
MACLNGESRLEGKPPLELPPALSRQSAPGGGYGKPESTPKTSLSALGKAKADAVRIAMLPRMVLALEVPSSLF